MNIQFKLENQLQDIEKRMNNADDFKEWAILQNAKATILAALQKYED
ncbi:hypothetical protein [Bacillus sp. UMB0728]|nr:hypothetical protein [Bacillus sp. UMB0728]